VLDNALQGRETANFEFPLYTKDRQRVEVLLNATTRRDVSGAVVGMIGVGQDITERKQVEVEKTRVAQELQTFIDTANAPIFGIDARGLVNEWNNKAAAITGFSREEVLGKNLVQVALNTLLCEKQYCWLVYHSAFIIFMIMKLVSVWLM
jgi:PAS domain-containing protein